ncbi:MAG: ATP-dependent dethiobiotin synthetase BioD [Acidimicrobiales bacterium]
MRPRRLVVVVGTGTDVGKTWTAARLVRSLREQGLTVAARKPAQSFAPGDDRSGLDSAVLGAATGESPETVCPPHRWYEAAMAPPMAADALGRDRFTTDELVRELAWPALPVDVGLVESAGGVRSPQAHDGDAVALLRALAPDLVLLVADAGLGAINAVRLSVDALPDGTNVVVVLNRYDGRNELHVRNRRWLSRQDGLRAVGMPAEEPGLAALVRGR